MLLDLSAASASVDHAALLQQLHMSYGLDGTVINWLASYLSGRMQCVRSPRSSSSPSALLYGAPQGSVLGPILFLLYTADVLGIVKRHQLHPHAYADDTQTFGFCSPLAVSAIVDRVSACFDDVSAWTKSNRLQLNPLKTEVLWCLSADVNIRSQRHQLESVVHR